MLTEVDTRDVAGFEVSLYMDTEEQVYLVCVQGHEPIRCTTRTEAVNVWQHPWSYMPLGGHRSPPNATEGATPTPLTPGGDLSHRTADALIGLRNVLADMNVPDFEWTAASVRSMIDALRTWRDSEHFTGPPPDPPKPYGEEDIEF